MLNKTQLEMLEGYLGEKGNYTLTILEAEELDERQKIFYLEKAITEEKISFQDFLKELAEGIDNPELVNCFKVINDLCANNELDYTYGGSFFPTTQKVFALAHYFKGSGDITPEVYESFKQVIQKTVKEHITTLHHQYHSADFWKKRIRTEFILIEDNLDDIEAKYVAGEKDRLETQKSGFWRNIYKGIEKKSYQLFSSKKEIYVMKAVSKGNYAWFQGHKFLSEYLYLSLQATTVEKIQCKGGNFIDYAIYHHNQSFLDLMFSTVSSANRKAFLDLVTCLVDMGESYFHQAVAFRQKTVVENRIAAGEDVNRQTYSLKTPLFLACRYGHLEIVELLLAKGAAVNQRCGIMEDYPLKIAIDKAHFEVAKLLINKGASIYYASGQSFLSRYCQENNTKAVEFLSAYTNAKADIGVELKGAPTPFENESKFSTLSHSTLPSVNERELNEWEKKALEELQSRGLTAPMLLSRHDGGYEFGEKHYFALEHLVNKRGISIQNALNRIEGLSSGQVKGIEEGLSRGEVLQFNNFWHIGALSHLKKNGLTAQMLLSRHDGGHEFSVNHFLALMRLVYRSRFSIQNALDQIEGLSSDQAAGIEEGLSRGEVLQFNNFWYITALASLKEKGLTAQMLLSRHDGGHQFDEYHCRALENLVKKRGFSMQKALDEIEGFSWNQANRIRNGETREAVLGNSAHHIGIGM
jgi:Ankyrin repeats (3 copies)